MVKTAIVTDKVLSDTLESVSETLIGEKTGLSFIGIEDSNTKDIIDRFLKENKTKDGVLFIVDRFGTSYSSHLLELAKNSQDIEILSGMNIPMLISASKYSIKAETSLRNLVENVKSDSLKSVLTSTDFFGSFEKN